MKHFYEKPHGMLTEYVRTVLIIEGYAESGSNELPVFTNGIPTLYFSSEKNNNDEKITRLTSFFKSPDDSWVVNKQTTIIAYSFKPFALACLLNVPASKLSETSVDLNTWNPLKYKVLQTQLMDAKDTSGKIKVLDNFLIQQLKENQQSCKIILYATDQIMNNSAKEIIPEILATLDLNERTFQRMFKKYVGITPTKFRRICQFQQSFGQLRGKDFNNISEVAYENGFADQSHFIRSFKEFTKTTPNDYLKKGLKNKKS
jgi:AraC-like DNA-binding protein